MGLYTEGLFNIRWGYNWNEKKHFETSYSCQCWSQYVFHLLAFIFGTKLKLTTQMKLVFLFKSYGFYSKVIQLS